MSQPRLVLASGSPRRRQLLSDAGYAFDVITARPGVEEAGEGADLPPAELVVDLATRKLEDVVLQLGDHAVGTLVLAADTVAECGGEVLGKPRDADHARAMMQALSGREHRVFTGVVAALGAERLFSEAVVTTLRMDELSDAWIEEYAHSGAWRGKAGGFGYQDGLGFVHVTEGSESNVVGLPMEFVAERLAEAGCFPAGNGQA
ncbi:Maf-like protein YhdE [Planctomycetes bacterium MalM25]|nr:Maf-like protein YhdE [Planctomycetes bacterium MalM25]